MFLTQTVTPLQLDTGKLLMLKTAADLGGACYDYEPDENEILEELLPRNVNGVQIFFAHYLKTQPVKQGSRMTAMDSATRNAGDMIDSLRTTYNRSRQAVITNELD